MRDPRVDAYIAKSADFAKPILRHLRALVHEVCPDAQETIKWGMPHFVHRGVLASMAAFNAHCAFGFWRDDVVPEPPGVTTAMGHLGRLTTVADLPARRTLAGYIRTAVRLNESGAPAVRGSGTVVKTPKRVRVPAALAAALARHPRAAVVFDGFSPSQKREYVEWVTEAKQSATRDRRLKTALEWMAAGKRRNWKYERRRA